MTLLPGWLVARGQPGHEPPERSAAPEDARVHWELAAGDENGRRDALHDALRVGVLRGPQPGRGAAGAYLPMLFLTLFELFAFFLQTFGD